MVNLSFLDHAFSKINNNVFFKIIAPTLIENPVALIELSEYYFNKKDIEKAKYYLILAEYKMNNSVSTSEMKIKFNKMKDSLNIK